MSLGITKSSAAREKISGEIQVQAACEPHGARQKPDSRQPRAAVGTGWPRLWPPYTRPPHPLQPWPLASSHVRSPPKQRQPWCRVTDHVTCTGIDGRGNEPVPDGQEMGGWLSFADPRLMTREYGFVSGRLENSRTSYMRSAPNTIVLRAAGFRAHHLSKQLPHRRAVSWLVSCQLCRLLVRCCLPPCGFD